MLLPALLAVITGTVFGPDGAPVAKARVAAYRAGTPRVALASAVTNEQGAFALDAGTGVVVLAAEADGLAPMRGLVPADEQQIDVTLQKAKKTDASVAANDKPAGGGTAARPESLQKITGVVRDAAKKPIGGMPVLAISGTGTTEVVISDTNGAFTFFVAPGKRLLRIDGGAYFSSAGVQTSGGAPVELIATRLATIHGVVRDEDGKPAGGALVSFEDAGEHEGIPTTANGRFQLHVVSGAEGRVVASKRAMPEAATKPMTIPAAGVRGVVLTIPRGVEVKGVVTDGRGHPLGGVAIQRAADNPPPFAPAGNEWAVTADDGSFTVHMKSGADALVFAKKGFVSETRQLDVAPGMRPLAIALTGAAIVRGTLVRKDGTPAGGEMLADADMQTSTRTAEDGSFELDFPAPGNYPVFTGASSRKLVVQAPSSNVRLVIDEGLSIRGRVIDALTGEAIEHPSVMVEQGEQARANDADASQAPGEFTIHGLDAGPATIIATAAVHLRSRVKVEAGRAEPVVIALRRGVALRGRVHDPAGQPLEGVSLQQQETSNGNPPVSAADGTFEVDGLPPDEQVTLRFVKTGYITRDVSVRVAKPAEPLDVVLKRGIAVRGHVLDSGGSPVSMLAVNVATAVYGAISHDAMTDENGAFAFDGLAPGHYDFSAGERGSAQFGTVRDIDVERVHELTIRLERRPAGTLAGRVAGMPVPSYMRELQITTSAGSMPGGINADGTFRVDGVPAGTATVVAMAGGINAMRTTRGVTVDVAAESVANVALAFDEPRTLRGRVTHNGHAVPHSTLSFDDIHAGSSARATTADDGAYEVRLDPGTYRVTLPGAPYRGQVDVEQTATFDIAFDSVVTNVLVVDSESGEPVEGVLVAALRFGEQSQLQGTTDAGGRTAIELVRDKKYTLMAAKRGYGNAVAEAVEGDVVMKLARSAGAVVRIVDARDGRTLSGYAIVRDAAGRIIDAAHQSDADGTSTLAVGPGEYRFSASAEGYGSETVRALVPSGEIRIALPRGGQLLLRSNQEVHGTARLLLPDGEAYVRCWCSGIATIELNGRATAVDAISPGSYTLEVTPSGGKARHYPVTVIEGETVPVQID